MRVLVQSLSVRARASQAASDGGLPVAEGPPSFGRIQPTSRGRSVPRRPAEREFSSGTKGYGAGQ
jgi:hypothetical protein